MLGKPQLAKAQAERALELGLAVAWATGDEVYGRSGELREVFERRGIGYVFAIGRDFQVTTSGHQQMRANQTLGLAERPGWSRRSAGAGSKGPRHHDWAWIVTASPRHHLLIRRSISNPGELAYYLALVPEHYVCSVTDLVKVAGTRWAVEDDFQDSKQATSLDGTQVRGYRAWKRRATLAMAAIAPAHTGPPTTTSGYGPSTALVPLAPTSPGPCTLSPLPPQAGPGPHASSSGFGPDKARRTTDPIGGAGRRESIHEDRFSGIIASGAGRYCARIPGVTPADRPAVSPPDRWTASTVYTDMWLDPDDDPRETDAELQDERATLIEYLRVYRLTLKMKCADLDAQKLACRSVPPSTMSLLGLIRHMAGVEHHWFRRVMAGEDVARLYVSDEDRDADWNGAVADPAVVSDAWAAWRYEVAFAEELVAATSDLGARGRQPGGSAPQLRGVLIHMIEEYARHCGHADLLRERIDGRVGQ